MGRDKRGTKQVARNFEEYFSDVWGPRWSALRQAMRKEPRKVALYNRCCQLPFEDVIHGMQRIREASLLPVFAPADSSTTLIEKPMEDPFHIRGYYILDYASALVVEQLHVQPFDRVLDLCAAPGGKSIGIAQFLSPSGQLTCNEAQADRCSRLRRNLQDYLPPHIVPWSVSQRNAERWHGPMSFSRVLVDAPCSSERHLLCQSNVVDQQSWSLQSAKKAAARQVGLLCRALEACEEGGRVVYSTCSISPLENDEVIREVLRVSRCQVTILPATFEGAEPPTPQPPTGEEGTIPSPARAQVASAMGEPTEYGCHILPDTCDGWGPIYYAVIVKVKHQKAMGSSSDDEDDDSINNSD